MPLTARLRDEENERINAILNRALGLDYIPENGVEEIDVILAEIGLSLQLLLDFNSISLVSHLQKLHFDWDNAEQFADFILKLASRLQDKKFNLAEKAIAIYTYIQTESKTFSWIIASKIKATQKC